MRKIIRYRKDNGRPAFIRKIESGIHVGEVVLTFTSTLVSRLLEVLRV